MSSTNTTNPDTHDRSATFNASALSIRCPITGYRVRAIFRIYAKTTAALARVACHRALTKISDIRPE
jgi:hypothetical protein